MSLTPGEIQAGTCIAVIASGLLAAAFFIGTHYPTPDTCHRREEYYERSGKLLAKDGGIREIYNSFPKSPYGARFYITEEHPFKKDSAAVPQHSPD